MGSIKTDSMSPSSSKELVMSLDYSRADTKRTRQGHVRPRVRNVAIDNAMAQRSQTQHRSGPLTKRHDRSEVDEVVYHPPSSRSSRELDSVLAQASVSSRGTSQDLAMRPRSVRTHQLPSPPPEEFQYRRGQVEPMLSAFGAQTSRDLQGFGAWCDPSASSQQLVAGNPYNYEEVPRSARSRRDSICIAPSTPRDRLLPTPELSPMPTHFVFCPCCCVDEDGRINETWHMAGPEKMDTQLEYAMAYIERMKST